MTLNITSQAYLLAPHQTLAAAAAAGPFVEAKVPFYGRITLVCRHHAIQDFLKDTGRFVTDARHAGYKSAFGIPFLPKPLKLMSENLLSMDDPDHARLRRLSDAPFRRAAIAASRPKITEAAHVLLDRMEAEGNTDLVAGLCRKLPLRVIYDMLGFRPETEAKLSGVLDGLAGGDSVWTALRAVMKIGEVQTLLREEFEALRREPRPGLATELVQAETEGERMSENELVAMVFVLFAAGHETTAHLLSTGIWTLLTTPGAADQVRAMDEDARLVAVDELMRYCVPVQMTKPRFIAEDTEFLGRSFRRKDKLFALLAAGNMDAEEFPDPLKMNLARRPNRHVGFGTGPHQCLGLHLARTEAEVALEALFARYPGLAIEGDPNALRWIARPGLRGLKRLPLRMEA
ncbi:MAG: cytochrome P450 [Hyphomonas sp.]